MKSIEPDENFADPSETIALKNGHSKDLPDWIFNLYAR